METEEVIARDEVKPRRNDWTDESFVYMNVGDNDYGRLSYIVTCTGEELARHKQFFASIKDRIVAEGRVGILWLWEKHGLLLPDADDKWQACRVMMKKRYLFIQVVSYICLLSDLALACSLLQYYLANFKKIGMVERDSVGKLIQDIWLEGQADDRLKEFKSLVGQVADHWFEAGCAKEACKILWSIDEDVSHSRLREKFGYICWADGFLQIKFIMGKLGWTSLPRREAKLCFEACRDWPSSIGRAKIAQEMLLPWVSSSFNREEQLAFREFAESWPN